ncbi:unnamed protein product [Phaedon cochleariae]|uniref:Uncharacterized protein n=1 Tax=Phaedon cochleariae TaxID=80249 RepID=A0A9N9SDJ8_PHACE|nr:unnamed protein product [Phaedon cochleariae]
MSTEKEKIKATVQGVGSPVPVQVRGGGAGLTGPSSSNCGSPLVENQAKESILTTGEDEIFRTDLQTSNRFEVLEGKYNPFRRSDSLRRTPPRRTSNLSESGSYNETIMPETFSEMDNTEKTLLPNLEYDVTNLQEETQSDVEQRLKRKRQNETPEKLRGESKEQTEILRKNIEMISKQVKLLNKLIKASYKPKTELLDITRAMNMCTRQLENEGVMKWLEEVGRNTEDVNLQNPMQCPQKEMVTIGTQVTEDELEKELEISEQLRITKMKNILEEDTGFIGVSEAMDESWPEEIFKRAKLKDIDVSSLNRGGDIVVIVNPRDPKVDKTIGTLELIFPGVSELMKNNDGQVDFVLHTNKTMSKNREESEEIRAFYIVPWGNTSGEIRSIEELYTQVKILKATMEIHPTDNINVIVNGGLEDDYMRKIFEYIFHKEAINITILAKPAKGVNKALRPTPERMVIKCEGKTYADMLRDIKGKVDIGNMGINIRTIKKTMKGDLMLELDGGKGNANILKEEIMKKMTATNIRVHRQETQIHINDIDAITQAEEDQKRKPEILGNKEGGNTGLTTQASKRKRGDITPENLKHLAEDKECFTKALDKLLMQVKVLDKMVGGIYKAKKELLELSGRMTCQANQLQEYRRCLDALSDEGVIDQFISMQSHTIEMVNMSTQVSEEELEKELQIRHQAWQNEGEF